MSFKTLCPNCNIAMNDVRGTRWQCRKCGESFAVDDLDEPSSPQKPGTPAMLLAIISIVAVLLLAGGIGAYLAFPKTDKQENEPLPKHGANPIRSEHPGTGNDASKWSLCHEEDGRYRINFPRAPGYQVRPHTGPNGKSFDLIVHYCEDYTEVDRFIAAHELVPNRDGKVSVDYILDEAFSNNSLRPNDGIEKSRKPITYQGYPGREIILEFPDRDTQGVGRLILANDRIILLVVSGPELSPDSVRAKAFLESLKIE